MSSIVISGRTPITKVMVYRSSIITVVHQDILVSRNFLQVSLISPLQKLENVLHQHKAVGKAAGDQKHVQDLYARKMTLVATLPQFHASELS